MPSGWRHEPTLHGGSIGQQTANVQMAAQRNEPRQEEGLGRTSSFQVTAWIIPNHQGTPPFSLILRVLHPLVSFCSRYKNPHFSSLQLYISRPYTSMKRACALTTNNPSCMLLTGRKLILGNRDFAALRASQGGSSAMHKKLLHTLYTIGLHYTGSILSSSSHTLYILYIETRNSQFVQCI